MSKPLPPQFADDAKLAAEYEYSLGTNTPVHRLAQFLVMGDNPAERDEALLSVRDALRGNDRARENYLLVLQQAQSPTMRQMDPAFAELVQASFARDVANGSMTAADVRDLVATESRTSGAAAPEAAGTAHVGLAMKFARLSSYVDGLGNDPNSQAARQAFIDASIDRAIAVRESSPALSSELYAQAANAMSAQTPAQIEANLQAIAKRDGPQGVARFAAGAAAGEAERATPNELPSNMGHPDLFKCDGLAVVMQKVNGQIDAGIAAGKPNVAAESLGGQLFTGTTAFLNAARGSALDKALNENDARTGLRSAMTATLDKDFPAILRQNARPDGEGLEPGSNGGYDTLSAYARFERGAPGDAHGRATSDAAARALGQKLGTLQGDLLKAERDGGADLRRDFGSGTFGDRAHEQANGAQILGAMIGSVQNGINQDFDVRADRSAASQAELKEKFELAAKVTSYAAKAVGDSGAGAVLEKGSTALEALANATPQTITQETGRAVQFGTMFRQFSDDLAKYRPNHDLANQMSIGQDHSNTEFVRYQTERQHQKTHDAQEATQHGLGKLLTGTLVPKTDDVALAQQPREMSKADVAKHTAEAVERYNADPKHTTKLPKPSDVAEWNGTTNQKGVVLQLGADDYVISTGRGGYSHFDTQQTHGTHPVPDKTADLNKDGTIHQHVAGREALNVGGGR